MEMPYINNLYNDDLVEQITNDFLCDVSNKLGIKGQVKYMFRLLNNTDICVRNANDSFQLERDLVPERIEDVAEIIEKKINTIYVSYGQQMHYPRAALTKIVSLS